MPSPHEVIVADSGSRTARPRPARAAGARVIDAGRGYGRACAAGPRRPIRRARVIVFLDGDGADRGDLLARIAGPVLAGTHDFVLASRTRGAREPGSMLWHQVLAGRLAGLGIGALYGVRYSDMCAFRAIDRDALSELELREMTLRLEHRDADAGRPRASCASWRCRCPTGAVAGGASKVAGSLKGTLHASWNIATACLRVAASPAPKG